MKRSLRAILFLAILAPIAALAQEQPPPSTTPPTGTVQQPPSPPPPAPPPKQGIQDRMFFGGGVGFGFGDVDWVSISPVVGFKVTPKLSTGVGLTYRHNSDNRYSTSLTTNDYGGDVFAQYTLFKNIFAMAEYEYMNYEYYNAVGDKISDSFDSVLAGGGIFKPMGGHASMVLSVLYNFSYSSNDPSPYGSPWVYTAGVAVGF
jgi:hypothetical protein